MDYPELTPTPVEGRDIPRCREYAQNEYDLNEENVKAAVSSQGEDAMENPVFGGINNI